MKSSKLFVTIIAAVLVGDILTGALIFAARKARG